MQYLPIFLNVRGRQCLVVGGGHVASRKVELLRQAGAAITVAAPSLTERLGQLANTGAIIHHSGVFSPELLNDKALVIAACADKSANRWVYEQANRRNIPVNVVDNPELCSFIMPAIVDRSPLMIAISSGGAAPVLARILRERLESLLPANLGRLAAAAGNFRERVKQRLNNLAARRRFWELIFNGPLSERVASVSDIDIEDLLEQQLTQVAKRDTSGAAYLIATGPGDPDLLTFRALRLMQQSDVILYDQSVADAVLNLTRRDAERISVTEDEAIIKLIAGVRAGLRVCRLMAGDGLQQPNLNALAQAGIELQIVPGVTATATAAPSTQPALCYSQSA